MQVVPRVASQPPGDREPEARRDWPLRFYSPERLFSKEARLGWVEPDQPAFQRALNTYFDGAPDPRTVAILEGRG